MNAVHTLTVYDLKRIRNGDYFGEHALNVIL